MDRVEKFIKQLKSEDADDRRIAAHELAIICAIEAVPALIGALKDEDWNVQDRAAWALERIGDVSSVPALIEALKDEDRGLQWRAAKALKGIVEECGNMEAFEKIEKIEELVKIEKGINDYSTELRKGRPDKTMLINTQIKIAKLTREIAERKDELAPKRDLLLTDKPKPPKKGRGMYQVSRRVRNG